MLAQVAAAQVKNPFFEQGTGNALTSWTMFGNAYRDQTQPYEGAYDLKLFGNFTGGANTTGAYQLVPMSPGRRIETTVWAINRTADPMAGNNYALLKVIYRNAANVDLASSESKRITATSPRDVWHRLSASLDPAPAGTTQCAVFLLFIQPSSTPFASGATLFDKLEFIPSKRSSERLVFQDEFNGSTLASGKWEPMIGDGSAYGNPGWGNNELQYYTSRADNLAVNGGLLRITARRENFGGKQYTSARIRSKGKADFTYGRIEARIKLVAGNGLWPAFWMLPSSTVYGGWAGSGEIDIIETVNAADRAHHTIHHGGAWPNNTSTGGSTFLAGGYAAAFHTYAIDWRPDSIRWSVDGVETYRLNSTNWYSLAAIWNQRAPFDEPFHMLLNLAVGGNWPGNPDASTPFPAQMQVDWVRVYQDGEATRTGGLTPGRITEP